MKITNPDIKKYCPTCGAKIERKYFGDRIEDYAAFKRRKFCGPDCYRNKKKVGKEQLPIAAEIIEEAAQESLEPLAYMLKVMNDSSIDARRRDTMASLAAPYCHKKADAKLTKEEERQKKIDSGPKKFESGPAPKIVGRIGK
jgi:hypothetical protein